MTFSKKGRKVRSSVQVDRKTQSESLEEVLRRLQEERKASFGNYRERSLAIHGLVCARCGRSFSEKDIHLLTVHHKDGNHFNNPADGSNWENLCVYCHENIHSREILADYLAKDSTGPEFGLVYTEETKDSRQGGGFVSLGDVIKKKRR
ncbi:MAG: YajD family HNH nuclease [Syntrophales bacterium]|nr:YajD family HNH nuclease [Syntrophales bacterium]